MTKPEPHALLEEATRTFLVATLPKLPETIAQLMLADGAVRAGLDLPSGDYVRLFDRRFERAELFRCLRDVANGRTTTLVSDEDDFSIDGSELLADGSAILSAGSEKARFGYAGMLSEDRERRLQTLEALELAELPPEREGQWRAALEVGPLDDALLTAFEAVVLQSPEATFRRIWREAEGGIMFDALVPGDANHFAGLLAIAPLPDNLAAYRDAWLDAVAGLDERRLSRALSIAAPLSILRGTPIVSAARGLDRDRKLAVARHMASCADPFTMLAAVQIAATEASDADFRQIVDALLPRLVAPEDEGMQAAASFLCSALILTTAVSASRRTLADLPVYARRLAWFLHASHLTRLFGGGQIDPADLLRLAGLPLLPSARLVDLCDARDVPHNLVAPFAPGQVHALLLTRVQQALFTIPEPDRPASWTKMLEEVLTPMTTSTDAILLMMPGPFDPFDEKWSGLLPLDADALEEPIAKLSAGTDIDGSLSDLLNLAMAFEADPSQRDPIVQLLPVFVKALPDAQFVQGLEVSLVLAARWRMPALAEALVNVALNRSAGSGLSGLTAAPRFFLLAAGGHDEVADWKQRAGEYASAFAFAARPGAAIDNLLRALDIICDASCALEPHLAAARSYAMLGRDRLTPRGGGLRLEPETGASKASGTAGLQSPI